MRSHTLREDFDQYRVCLPIGLTLHGINPDPSSVCVRPYTLHPTHLLALPGGLLHEDVLFVSELEDLFLVLLESLHLVVVLPFQQCTFHLHLGIQGIDVIKC